MKIHFIGIGGIGISGLAQYMHHKGHKVSGSDISDTIITQKLKKQGIEVTIPHNKSAIKDQDLVIHSAIIREENPEIIAAKEKNITVKPRREALKEILADKKVYSVAGAHGKSTTTAILASIMDGSAIIGAESKAFGNNVRYNDSNDIMIFEADESDGSFLNSNPYLAIVTNAEPEHMEYYDYNLDRFYGAYEQFLKMATIRVIINGEDEFLSSLDIDAIRLYPSKDIKNIEYVLIDGSPYTKFELLDYGEFRVFGLGEHIALDTSLAILATIELGEDIDEVRENLLNYQGIKKRFDIVENRSDMVVIDDYGHHPTEIKVTIDALKEYSKLRDFSKISAIWQPHKYSRTMDNLKEFIECFDGIDELVILPIWSSGEIEIDIDLKGAFRQYNPIMADRVKKEDCVVKILKAQHTVKEFSKDIIVAFGAGDITYQIRGE